MTNSINVLDWSLWLHRTRFRLQIHCNILYIVTTGLLTFNQTMVNDTIDIPCYIWLFRALVPSQICSFIVSTQLHHSDPKIRIMKIQWLITFMRWSANLFPLTYICIGTTQIHGGEIIVRKLDCSIEITKTDIR